MNRSSITTDIDPIPFQAASESDEVLVHSLPVAVEPASLQQPPSLEWQPPNHPLAQLDREKVIGILPWVLAPLGIAALMNYLVNAQTSANRAEQDLQDRAVSLARSTRDRLNEVKKVPSLVAPDPAVLEFSERAGQIVEAAGLQKASAAQVQKLLPSNPLLNESLQRMAAGGHFAQLLIAERHGLPIASAGAEVPDQQQTTAGWQQTEREGYAVEPVVDSTGQTAAVEIAQRISEPQSGKFLGAVRGKLAVDVINQALNSVAMTPLSKVQQVQILAIDLSGSAKSIGALTSEGVKQTIEVFGGEGVVQQAIALFKHLRNPTEQGDSPIKSFDYGNGDRGVLTTLLQDGKRYTLVTIPGSNWVAVASLAESDIIGAMAKDWIWAIAAIVLTLAGLVAAFMAQASRRQLSRSLQALNQAMQRVAKGELDVSLIPSGPSDVQQLSETFNQLTTEIRSLLLTQSQTLQHTQLYVELAARASQGNSQAVFDLAVQTAKAQLHVDRVVIYRFNPNWSGEIVAEAVDPQWAKALNESITDPCIPRTCLEELRNRRYTVIDDVQAANMSVEHRHLLERLQVKAKLVTSIVVGEQLLGLLIVHQCTEPRAWQEADIRSLCDLAAQVGLLLTGPTLTAQKAAEAERAQFLQEFTNQAHASLDFNEILNQGVEAMRRAVKTDRVLVYRFNPDWQSGLIVAESVGSGWLRAIGQTIADPLVEGAVERYTRGRVWTTDNIEEANLSACHCEILNQLQVKANMVVPVITQGRLYGLVCAHQCSGPRVWQQAEIDLFGQMATQLGSALNQAALLDQQAEAAQRAQQLNTITFEMRESLDHEQIFSVVVKQTREALHADRVIVYLFDQNWQGSIVAESVVYPWDAALGSNIADPCFADSYVEKYKRGRVQATTSIYAANLDPCYVRQLEAFHVEASVVAPILVKDNLYGLLVAHQCSGPREWQESEIRFFRQVALQLGFALDHANRLQQQQAATHRAEQLNALTVELRELLNPGKILTTAVDRTRKILAADRVLVYWFDEDWYGTIIAESVEPGFPVALDATIADPCFAKNYIDKYEKGRVQAVPNIYEANLDSCYLGQLEPFGVKANLVAPILITGKLLGLFVAHQCSAPRLWEASEIDFFRQTAIQLGFALSSVELIEQREQARLQADSLQQQLVSLLEDIEGAARGDLTVRAEVTVGEIGTVADFFNSLIESLRQIVTQVKQSALQVNEALSENQDAMQQLAEDAMQQAEETSRTLKSVEQITQSIQVVADSAQQAAKVARTASHTAETGGVAMDLTVQNILTLRDTIGETAKKVKRLGESSQEISKVVSLINQIALQTNLLAINAGIEATKAGEGGQGFAVVAEEVGELAARSAAATQEIEEIVATIQRETNEVVQAMEEGTTQVVEGTQLVNNTKHNLEQIVAVSREIDELAQSISEATASQVESSYAIAQLIEQAAQVAAQTSQSSDQVSRSLQQTGTIAEDLQESVGMFKVN